METDEKTNEVVVVHAQQSSEKSLKLLQAISLVFGMMIGSGIFITVGQTFTAFESNSIGMVMIFWIIGGLVSILGGLIYAELGTRIPESGGERAYYKKAFNDKFSITFVLSYIFLVKGITLAALAITAGSYLNSAFGAATKDKEYIVKLIAAAILFVCFVVNCASKKLVNSANVIFSVIKMGTLLLIISIGMWYLGGDQPEEWKQPFVVKGFDIVRLSISLINVFWSFEGWNTLGMVAGDMVNPSRDLPLAIGIGAGAVTILYLFANVAYSAVLGYDFVRTSTTVASSFSTKVLKAAAPVIPVLICCSATGAVNGTFYATGSVIMSAGYQGELGKIFSLVQRSKRTPVIALFVELLIACTFLSFDFQKLLNYASFLSWLFYFISTCALLKLKFQTLDAQNKNIFQIPMLLTFPIQLVCVFTVVMCFYLSPAGCGTFLGFVILIFIILCIPERYKSFSIINNINEKVCNFFIDYMGLEYANELDVK